MIEFLKSLFSSEGFMPHGHCLLWKPSAVWLHVISDSSITLAYYSIPITLLYFVRKRRALAFQWVFLMFTAFISGCGTTHPMEIWTLWVPTYWLDGIVKALTALLSLVTAVAIVPLVPQVLSLRSPAELEAANRELEKQIAERKQVEETSYESERRYRLLAENSTDVIWTTDMDLRFTYLSPSVIRQRGYSVEEAMAQTLDEVLTLSSFKVAMDAFMEELAIERTEQKELFRSRTLELELSHKDGSTVWTESKVTFLRDRDSRPVGILGVTRDITERKQAEEQIKASLEEKEVLLREIHHRVKNNLQVISSLLDLQSRYISDEQSNNIFKESQSRIKSMAFVHEKLYQSKDLARINLAEYIRDLATNLFHSYGVSSTAIKLKITADDTLLDINTAVPLGLVINELVSNSLKHGFPKEREGKINIELRSDNNGKFTLTVSDNGVGFSKDLDFQNTKSLGLRLVRTLTDQLKGNIEIRSNGGTEFKIIFEKPKYRGRG